MCDYQQKLKYINDDALRTKQDHDYKLMMTEEDYKLLEDQKTSEICPDIEDRLSQSWQCYVGIKYWSICINLK